ncbi:MAG: transglycosylase [Acidimicrobiales bacterium]|nr:transglycosylase [Acidimicrobiales bacterium]
MHRLRQQATLVVALMLIVTLGAVGVTGGGSAQAAESSASNVAIATSTTAGPTAADMAKWNAALRLNAERDYGRRIAALVEAIRQNNLRTLWIAITLQREWAGAAYAAAMQGANARPVQGSGRCGGDLPPCCVMMRESGGNIHAQNPSSSASGKWQFIDSTWAGYGGYAHAKDAPESVQDAKARELWAGGAGAGHWGGGC